MFSIFEKAFSEVAFSTFEKAFIEETRKLAFEEAFVDELAKLGSFGSIAKSVGKGVAGLAINMAGSEVADAVVAKKPEVSNVYVHPVAFQRMQQAQMSGQDPKAILRKFMSSGKQAGMLGALWSAGKSIVAPLLGRGAASAAEGAAGNGLMRGLGQAAGRVGPAAKAFATQYPKASKAVRWGAGQAAQGVGFSLAAAPFQQREKVTKVLPYPSDGGAQ